MVFLHKYVCVSKIKCTFAPQKERIGALAQLVEHRTENPCVPGSIPGGTTPPFISPVIGFDHSRVFFVTTTYT